MKNSFLVLLIAIVSCNTHGGPCRTTIDLQGQWQFALDRTNVGKEQKWYPSDLKDSIHLPGITDFHPNWQWFSIIKASNSLIPDNTSEEYLPFVQLINNLERNHKLGLIFEFKVGQDKLLVCMSQLNNLTDRPEAVHLCQSIINYMNSEEFKPGYTLSYEELKGLITIEI